MIRNPRNKKYSVKAYRVRGSVREVFWCMPSNFKMVTDEMGMPMSNGNQVYETDSPIDFRNHDEIYIGNNTKPLTIDSVEERIDPKYQNARRGNPRYIKTIRVS